MIPIPGIIISILTFPGVIVHELAHQLFCRWYKVSVFKVCYFQFGNPVGYVLHEKPRKKSQQIMISVGPFIINTILGALIAFPAAIPVFQFDQSDPIFYVLIYLGVSIAMHSFPSTGDASVMWDSVMKEDSSLFLKIVTVPLVGLIYLGALGSFFWLDLVYGIAVAVWLPKLIIHFLV